MVRIGDADIRRGSGRDIGDDVIVDPAVIGIQLHPHMNRRIKGFKIPDRLIVDIGLRFVGVVLRPEGNRSLPLRVKLRRHFKFPRDFCAVTAGQRQRACRKRCGDKSRRHPPSVSHPFVPPLETPSMICLWKSRNNTIRGTEMTTTAAIMAGMFSLPKPFSRIS